MISRRIDNRHPFFDESLQFYLLNLATIAVGLHYETHKEASILIGIVNTLCNALSSDEKDGISIENRDWEPPEFPRFICWQDVASKEDCILHVSQSLVDYLRSGTHKPEHLEFDLRPTIQQTSNDNEIQFPAAAEGFEAVDGFIPTALFETVLAYLVGGSFERFKQQFASVRGASAKWPVELQFFRHLRNGCFHRNQFRIDQNTVKIGGEKTKVDQIDQSNPPKWHTYVMSSDAAINGKKVIGENAYFNPTHVLPLLDDMGQFT